MTDALNMAKAKAESDRKSLTQARNKQINQFTGLIDNPDGTHEFPEGGIVNGANMAQVKSLTK